MNYILMEVTQDGNTWGLLTTQNITYALQVANDIILQNSNIIQIWETEEDPDTFISANIIFSRNTNTGKSFTLQRWSDGKYEIKDNTTNEYISSKTQAGFLWVNDYTYSKHFTIAQAENIIIELTK